MSTVTIKPKGGGITLQVMHVDSEYGVLINVKDFPHGPKAKITSQAARYPLDELLAALGAVPAEKLVRTTEELDAAIIHAFENGENLVLLGKGGWRPYILWEDDRGNLHVTSTPMEDDPERLTLSDITLPATVLHEGAA